MLSLSRRLRQGSPGDRFLIYRLRFRLRQGVGGDASGPLRPSSALARGRNPSARSQALCAKLAATAMGGAAPLPAGGRGDPRLPPLRPAPPASAQAAAAKPSRSIPSMSIDASSGFLSTHHTRRRGRIEAQSSTARGRSDKQLARYKPELYSRPSGLVHPSL